MKRHSLENDVKIYYPIILNKNLFSTLQSVRGLVLLVLIKHLRKNSPKRRLRNGAAIKGRICLGYFIIHVKISPTSRSGKISPLQYPRMFETCQNE